MPEKLCHTCGETNAKAFKPQCFTMCYACAHDRNFKKQWGMTYGEMLVLYGDMCGICHMPEKVLNEKTGLPHRLCVDHDHKCCKKGCAKCKRGLLCRRCNYKLGQIEENLRWLAWALAYLGVQNS